ncbi:hypothetical protein B5723_15155, partial [Mammaliicoccus sciuri]
MISDSDHYRLMKEDSDIRHNFCIRSGNYQEYFKAKSLKQIRRETYLTMNGQDEVQGFTSVENDEYVFKAYEGSDNNGYLYVQDIEGEWLASVYEEGGYKFTPFERL